MRDATRCAGRCSTRARLDSMVRRRSARHRSLGRGTRLRARSPVQHDPQRVRAGFDSEVLRLPKPKLGDLVPIEHHSVRPKPIPIRVTVSANMKRGTREFRHGRSIAHMRDTRRAKLVSHAAFAPLRIATSDCVGQRDRGPRTRKVSLRISLASSAPVLTRRGRASAQPPGDEAQAAGTGAAQE